MFKENKNIFSLTAENLGPLEKLSSPDVKSKQMDFTIFALNGSGKTFISNAFQLIQDYQQKVSDISADDLISFGKKDMKFKFSFNSSDTDGKRNEFSITASRGNVPNFNLNSDWKIHVFNRDFITKHIKQETYTCSHDIPGDIFVGEENIKIHELETEIQKCQSLRDTTDKSLREFVNQEKNNFKQTTKISTIKDFTDLTYEYILQHPVDEHQYEAALEAWNNIKDYDQEKQSTLSEFVLPDTACIEKIMFLLKKEVPSNSLDKTLKNHLTKHFDFFKQGTALIAAKEDTCPFCMQSLDKKALEIVQKYKQFFADEEAKLVSDIEVTKISLEELQHEIKEFQTSYLAQAAEYEKQKVPFADFKGRSFPNLLDSFKRILETLDNFSSLLQKKLDNKTQTDFGQNAVLSAWDDDWTGIDNNIVSVNQLCLSFEQKKTTTRREELNLRRRLVQELGRKIYVQQKSGFEALLMYDKEIKGLNEKLTDLKARVKKSKRKEVEKTFQNLLKEFFDNYYTYDAEKGRLKHIKGQEINAASRIISEGEKSALAFCHYIALTHSLIETKDDYKQLFFVIDDPISSMDHNYTYQTVEIIRRIKGLFPENMQYARFLILTHNVEFANILFCNKISQHRLRLDHGQLILLPTTPILPYEGHLQHIYNVAIDKEKKAFYTPNCIRHILETIWRFKYPKETFDNFLEKENFFEDKKAQIGYTMIHDLSHGRWRTEISVTEEEVKSACELVVEYMKQEYPGQIEAYCEGIPEVKESASL